MPTSRGGKESRGQVAWAWGWASGLVPAGRVPWKALGDNLDVKPVALCTGPRRAALGRNRYDVGWVEIEDVGRGDIRWVDELDVPLVPVDVAVESGCLGRETSRG